MSNLKPLTKYQLRKIKSKTANWYHLCKDYYLPEDLIREYKDFVDWWNITSYQKLSEKFIIKFKNQVRWRLISKYQKLSQKFLIKFYKKIYFEEIPLCFFNFKQLNRTKHFYQTFL